MAKEPNRFHGLAGAAKAAERLGDRDKASPILKNRASSTRKTNSELDLACAVDARQMNPRSSNYEIVDQPSISRTAVCAEHRQSELESLANLASRGPAGADLKRYATCSHQRTRRRTSTGRHECREKFEQGCHT
jgi:hypothetical protein